MRACDPFQTPSQGLVYTLRLCLFHLASAYNRCYANARILLITGDRYIIPMNYDFDRVMDRRSTNAIKWNHHDADILPLWVADMDFAVPDAVIDALHARVDVG